MAADPGVKRQILIKLTKILVANEDTDERLNHAQSLTLQGQLHFLVDDNTASLWCEVVQKLVPECMNVALNAAQDTLPTMPTCLCGEGKLASLGNESSAMNAKHCYTY